ncbi:hypothetical protein Tco_1507175 [Tanacetum coccineum]
MANLEFYDTHNMVAYLKKPEGSEEFHQIVDFLNASHIRTFDNGEIELTATIDGKVKIVTEASIRRHLQLADSDGSTHPVESYHTPTSAPSTSQPLISPTSRRTNRQESVVPQSRSPTQTHVADEAASTGVDVRYGGATTTVTGLEAGQGSVESLETDLKQTKLTYGAAYTKLIKKVKKLENKVKTNQARRKARIVVSNDKEDLEDPSKQGRKISAIDQDPTISLVQQDAEIQGRQEHDMEFEFDLDAAKDVSTAEEDISTTSVDVSTATVSTAKDKGKGIMEESEPVQTKTKLQQEHERLGYEVALRLQAKLKEEERVKADEELAQRLQAEEKEKYSEAKKARLLAELINERKSEIERAILESIAGSSKRDAEEELAQESSKRQKTIESSVSSEEPKDKEEELSQERLQQMMIIVPEQGMNVEALQTKEDLVKLWIMVKEKFNSTEPTKDKEREIWVELKRLFEPDTNDELCKLQNHIHDLTLRLYDSCGVHHVSTEKGIDIYMLIEKEYPLSRETLTQMLVAKLLVE